MPTLTALAARPEPETDNRAVIATDFAGVIRHLTPAAEQLLGHYDLVGRSLRSLHVEEELQARATEIGMVGLDELEAVFARLRSGQVACERQRWTYLCADSARSGSTPPSPGCTAESMTESRSPSSWRRRR